ncbi:hypothetical protein [Thiocystis violacea]|uniref:hypothetical protein n=1 Tax=Thiocystis violacea TaxID=13725 RepID=UPI001904DE80|nr:hypothetical protein [Thiocystis violacea]MBK1717166.1 hypothetical protein [Thiocystis violacea]
MYTAVKGIYENGQVVLEEAPPTRRKTKVVVMFIGDEENGPASSSRGVRLGSLAGQGYRIPENFNDPLPDLSEYM